MKSKEKEGKEGKGSKRKETEGKGTFETPELLETPNQRVCCYEKL